MPVPRSEIQMLVQRHSEIKSDPMEGAIWIRGDQPDAWLVEILPQMSHIDDVERPFHFIPSASFRYELSLICGNEDDLIDAVARDTEFAEWVATGDVVYDGPTGAANMLVSRAKERTRVVPV